jgi:hypothetical protein
MANYGYDSFVIEDNYYNDSFYNDMVASINPIEKEQKNNESKSSFSNFQSGCQCYSLKKQLNNCKQMFFAKANEITEIKNQTFTLYILLIISVFIIITQRMSLNSLNNLIYIMKLNNQNNMNFMKIPSA